MITAIEIENFKGIGHRQRIELKPLTLLFGANSAGKSSVVHALHYAREVFLRRNLDADRTLAGGDQIDLGGFRSLVHQHQTWRRVGLAFEMTTDEIGNYFEDLPALSQYLQFERWTDAYLDTLGAHCETCRVDLSIAYSELRGPYVAELNFDLDGRRYCAIAADPQGKRVTLRLDAEHPALCRFDDWLPSAEEREYHQLEDAAEIFDDLNQSCLSYCLPRLRDICLTSDDAFYLTGLDDALLDWTIPLPLAPRDDEELPKLDHEETVTPGKFLEDMTEGLGRLLLRPLAEVADFLGELRYLGPLRATPPRHFQPRRQPDASRWSQGLAAWDLLFDGDAAIVSAANHWLARKDRLNAGCTVDRVTVTELTDGEVEIIQIAHGELSPNDLDNFDNWINSANAVLSAATKRTRLQLMDVNSSLTVAPADVGIGISQLIPVVVAALDEHQRPMLIEQPELHLHPAMQVALGDLFIHAIQKQGKSFILETHSEHLLLRLLRRIREQRDDELPPGTLGLSPQSLAVICVEKEEGQARVYPLRIDPSGEFIDRWPRGFFAERAEELF